MNQPVTIAIESLENRTFFSSTPSATIAADLSRIQGDKAQITMDKSTAATMALNDRLKLVTDQLKRVGKVTPLQVKLTADVTVLKTTILQNQVNRLVVRTNDQTTIAQDLAQLAQDRGNTTAVNTDLTKLATDRTKLITDMSSALDKINSDRTAGAAVIFQDRLAIVNARLAEDPVVTQDKADLLTHLFQNRATLANDQKQLATDQLKLLEDRLNHA